MSYTINITEGDVVANFSVKNQKTKTFESCNGVVGVDAVLKTTSAAYRVSVKSLDSNRPVGLTANNTNSRNVRDNELDARIKSIVDSYLFRNYASDASCSQSTSSWNRGYCSESGTGSSTEWNSQTFAQLAVMTEHFMISYNTFNMMLDDISLDTTGLRVGNKMRFITHLEHIFISCTGHPIVTFVLDLQFSSNLSPLQRLIQVIVMQVLDIGKLSYHKDSAIAIAQAFKASRAAAKGEYKSESLMDNITAINIAASDWLGILSSEFGNKLTTLICLLLCNPVLNKLGVNPEKFGYDAFTEKALRLDMAKYSGLTLPGVLLEHTTSILLKLSQTFLSIQKFGPTVGIRALFVSRDDFLQIENEYVWLKTNVRNFGCRSEVTNPTDLSVKQPFTLDGYFNRCAQVLTLIDKVLPALKKDPASKHRFERFKFDILGFQSDCAAELRVNESRPCPYALMLCGPPSIGKTMLVDIILTQLHNTDNRNNRFEIPFSPSLKYVYNPTDDFFSGFSTEHTSILLDDVAQKRPDLIKTLGGDDLMHLIRIINTVAFTPNQAELEKKGKTPMRCRYVIGTTNTPDLSAHHVFNCTSAVYRRMTFIHVEVKPEYRETGSTGLKGDDTNRNNLDLWDFVIEECRPVGNQVSRWYWNGTSFTNERSVIGVEDLVKFLDQDLERHWKKQDKAEIALKSLVDVGFCHHGISKLICSSCKLAVVKAESLSDEINHIRTCISFILVLPTLFCYLIGAIYYWLRPPSVFSKPIWPIRLGRKMIDYLPEDEITYSVRWIGWIPPKFFPYLGQRMYHRLYDEIQHNSAMDLYDRYCAETLQYWKYPAFVAAISVFWQFYKKYRNVPNFIGQTMQSKMPEPDAHEVVRKNHWLRERLIGVFPAVGGIISKENLETHVALNTVYVKLHFDDLKHSFFNALAVKSNLFVSVYHLYRDAKPTYCEVWILDKNGSTKKFEFLVDETNFYFMPQKDMMFMRFDRVRPFKDIVKYFSSSVEPAHVNCPGKYIYKDNETHETQFLEIKRIFRGSPRPYSSPQGPMGTTDIFEGMASGPTMEGMCGSPCLAYQSHLKMIVGIHTAGDGQGGVYVRGVSQDEIHRACTALSIVNINDNLQDVSYNFNAEAMQIREVHEMCPSKHLEHGEISIIGANTLPRVAPRTLVRKSPCWEEVLNYYRKYGYTKLLHTSPIECSRRAAILLSMEKAVENAKFKPKDIAFCVKAISKEFLDRFSKERLERLKPYPWSVAINGRDGIPYLERLPLSTSGGYGHTGPKRKLFELVNSTPEHAMCYDWTPELKSEVDWIIDQYENGLEANPVFKCSFKDEPITFEKAAKSKVRIFSSSPTAFSLVCRRYLLCIIREFVGIHRLDFEMAIGANAEGQDWDDIARHIVRHGENRCFAGDYKNFDKQMPPELILAAFDIIKNILIAAGWGPDDIRFIDGIARDIAFPTTDLFGTLVQLYGANPSGHVLTTPINSLVNSLYMRLACKSILEKHKFTCVIGGGHKHRCVDFTSFRDVMSVVTYGDDNCGTTSDKYPFINHTSIQAALADVGIIYTTDDKEAESKGFVHLDKITFLKRRFVYSKELNRYIAPLIEDSIFKSLTVWTYSRTICEQEQLAEVLKSASRAYFFYDRETFEERRNFFVSLASQFKVEDYLSKGGLPTYQEIYDSVQEVVIPDATEITVLEDVVTPTSG